MPWHPASDWKPLTSGTGQATGGVWRTPDGQVVKRLVRGVTDPRHHAFWERQALVAESGVVAGMPGLRAPACWGVERDADGITLRMAYTTAVAWSAEGLAGALGRFAGCSVAEPDWGARDVLRDRLRTVERRGGWGALSRAGLATPAIEELWARRESALDILDGLPRVPTHGDAHPVNLLGRDGDDVIAIDWEQFGLGPAGFDVGYLLLAVDVPLDDLVAAHGGEEAVRCGAALVAAYTGVWRAAWALTQPHPGDHLVGLAGVVEEAVGYLA
ncbi:aminoglycoside phosphotransferase family protein [Kribbella speibonae]|uniref:Aminoglycoside phosphotransferase family protein n=1 Tax=Kribbella speibonae TaxID=1572660 RepID=A0ABY1ZVE1_9ACTN|nr:aminoglycoside phosphotransferase family protein [Kribbella speibonae]TCC16993.1 aminoglycoside phosphotransferase family protein [Kribbella speibonae]